MWTTLGPEDVQCTEKSVHWEQHSCAFYNVNHGHFNDIHGLFLALAKLIVILRLQHKKEFVVFLLLIDHLTNQWYGIGSFCLHL